MEGHLNGKTKNGRGRLGGDTQASPTPHELRAFLMLAEEPHFGRTAIRLGLAQSSLSETIRRLEGKLDTVLFERSSRRVALTEAGERLLPIAREVLNALAAIQAVTAQASGSPLPSFRIGIEFPGLAELTRPVLTHFRARHPTSPLVLREFSCAHGFFEQGLDAAIVRTPVIDERLVVHPVATEPRTFLLPPDHPAADATQLSLLDLQDDAFVALEPRAPVARAYWLALEQWGGELPRIGAQAFTAGEIRDGVMHLRSVAIGVESGRRLPSGLAVVDAVGLPPNTIGLAVRADDTRPMVRDLVEVVRRVVAEQADLAPGMTPVALKT